jgi:hypothetical protein
VEDIVLVVVYVLYVPVDGCRWLFWSWQGKEELKEKKKIEIIVITVNSEM